MNAKQIGLSVLAVAFAALTVEAVYVHGVVGFFTEHMGTLSGVAIFADLVIALGLVLTWMMRDARDLGISPLPYVVLTLTMGSVGPLLYLIRREGLLAASPRAVRAAA
jgi:hypothetical protein